MALCRTLGDEQLQHRCAGDGLSYGLSALHEESPLGVAMTPPK
jgi:hypothetical protein